MTRNATTDMAADASRVIGVAAALALAVFLVFLLSPGAAMAEQLETAGTQLDVKTPAKSAAKSLVIARGHSATVSANEAGGQRQWSSSNAKVATVEQVGRYSAKVTAVSPGVATITATSDVGTLTCKVTVTGLAKDKVSLSMFKTGKLVFKGNHVVSAKKWKSSDAKCVKVNSKGKLTPMGTGQAVVSCTDSRGVKHKCVVTVKKPKLTCKITDRKYLYQKFAIKNKSGKTVKLNTNALCYSSSTASSPSCVLYTSSATGVALSKTPLKVGSGKTAKFFGQIKQSAQIPDGKGAFMQLGFKVGKVRYLAAFSPKTGKLLACARQ